MHSQFGICHPESISSHPLRPISLCEGIVVGYPSLEEKHRHIPDDVPKFMLFQQCGTDEVLTVRLASAEDAAYVSHGDQEVFEFIDIYNLPTDGIAVVYCGVSCPIHVLE